MLSIIALFSCCTLAAQEYIPTYGRELPRGEVIAYPTAQEAAAASAGDTRYFTRLADWTQKDNVFSTEFTVPFAWANRQVFFHLGWASADYEVRVNGKNAGSAMFGNTVGVRLEKGRENEVEIIAVGSLRNMFGPFHFKGDEGGISPWNFTFRGNWKDGKCDDFAPGYRLIPFGIRSVKAAFAENR